MPTKPTSSATADRRTQRSHLTIKQKIAIIQKKVEEPKWTQERLGRWAQERFQLLKPPTQATVSNILRTREQLLMASVSPDFCRVRAVKYPALDAGVHAWVLSLKRNGITYAAEDIKEKALQLVAQLRLPNDVAFSNGWVTSFMERHQLKLGNGQQQQQQREDDPSSTGIHHSAENQSEPLSNSTPGRPTARDTASANAPTALDHVPALFLLYKELLACYAPRDVFAMDEVGFFYCLEPKKSKSRRVAMPANNNKNKSRARISVSLAVNMDATEKLEPFFVGTEDRPTAADEMHFCQQYYYNSNAWVTGPIFQDWLLQLNSEMLKQNRQILLLVDDAPSHVQLELSNVKTFVLPAKRSHPLGVGISRTLKTLFRIRHLAHAVDQAEQGAANVFEVEQIQAMRWAKQAWVEVSPELVRRCWNQSGLNRGVLDAAAALPSIVKIDQGLEDTICGYLAHLNLLYQVSIESILSPLGEDDVHYVYSDATVSDLVVRKTGLGYTRGGAGGHNVDTFSNQSPAKKKQRRQSNNTLQRVELYRDVIALLDEESEIDDQLVHAIQFLRRKQAAARHELKRTQECEDGAVCHESGVNTWSPAPQPPGRSPAVKASSQQAQELIMAMMMI